MCYYMINKLLDCLFLFLALGGKGHEYVKIYFNTIFICVLCNVFTGVTVF